MEGTRSRLVMNDHQRIDESYNMEGKRTRLVMDDHQKIDLLFMDDQRIDLLPTGKAEDEDQTVEGRVFRVEDDMPTLKPKGASVPQVVSLGPFHYGKPQLAKYETFKNKLPDILADRPGRPPFVKLVEDMIHQSVKIRQWYKSFHVCPDTDEELGWILARDGLFLLRFLRKIFTRDWDCDQATRFFFLQNQQPSEAEEDIMKLENQTVMFAAVQEDIMKLENQIPMFVLQMILQWQAGTDLDLISILRHVWQTLSPFLYKRDRLDSHVLTAQSFRPDSHLLGFVYENTIRSSDPTDHTEHNRMWKKKRYITLPSAVELRRKGVKFAAHVEHLNEIRFDAKTCTFHLPTIEMDDRTDAVMRNMVAFEAFVCKNETKPLMCYVDVMDRLINTAADVEVLRNGGILHNRLGTDEAVANVWNKMRKVMGKGEYEPIDSAIDDVITFYTNYEYIMICAEIKDKYFPRAWLVISTFAGLIVLLLSVLQTFLAWEQVRLQRQSMGI